MPPQNLEMKRKAIEQAHAIDHYYGRWRGIVAH
jgi:hypothetical protein